MLDSKQLIKTIKFEELESKLIEYKNEAVLIDRDVAELYKVETRDINKAVKNNPDKFPDGYIIELTEKEKKQLVEKFHRFDSLKHSTVNPKVFTEKGLYMLATIIKSKIATDTTIKIIETFAKIKKLSRNLNAISIEQTQDEQKEIIKQSNQILEEIIDIEPVREIKDDNVTEIETRIELNLGFVKVSRIVKSTK